MCVLLYQRLPFGPSMQLPPFPLHTTNFTSRVQPSTLKACSTILATFHFEILLFLYAFHCTVTHYHLISILFLGCMAIFLLFLFPDNFGTVATATPSVKQVPPCARVLVLHEAHFKEALAGAQKYCTSDAVHLYLCSLLPCGSRNAGIVFLSFPLLSNCCS